jgi:hypothetical protein
VSDSPIFACRLPPVPLCLNADFNVQLSIPVLGNDLVLLVNSFRDLQKFNSLCDSNNSLSSSTQIFNRQHKKRLLHARHFNLIARELKPKRVRPRLHCAVSRERRPTEQQLNGIGFTARWLESDVRQSSRSTETASLRGCSRAKARQSSRSQRQRLHR